MFKAIAFGLAVGAGVQAWRNFPADGPVDANMLAVVFGVGVLFAYLGGRWHGRHKASAWASARAEATAVSSSSSTAQQQVNVAVVMPGAGAGSAAGRIPTEAAPWLAGSTPLREIELDEFEGLDLAELLPDSTPEAAG